MLKVKNTFISNYDRRFMFCDRRKTYGNKYEDK